MILTKQDVASLADLARIELTDDELSLITDQLDTILDAVSPVSQFATQDVVPTTHVLDLTNVFRPDEVKPSLPLATVLEMAGSHEDGRVRVPRILGEQA